MILTAREFSLLFPRLRAPDAMLWADAFAAPMRAAAIDTPARIAAFMAQIGHESGDLLRLVESLDYSTEGLARTWPSRFAVPGSSPPAPNGLAMGLGRSYGRKADQQGIAEIAYGGRMGNGVAGTGDGWKFRGRGAKQLTGRNNYRSAGEALKRDLEADPDWVASMDGAAQTACWFWASRGLNALADGDARDETRWINGGVIGLPDRQARLDRIRAQLGA